MKGPTCSSTLEGVVQPYIHVIELIGTICDTLFLILGQDELTLRGFQLCATNRQHLRFYFPGSVHSAFEAAWKITAIETHLT